MKNNKKPEDIKTLKAEVSRSKLLLDISRKIASIKNLSEILWTIVEFVTKNVDADRGTLFLNDEETNELYSRVAQGDLTREIRILNTDDQSKYISEFKSNVDFAVDLGIKGVRVDCVQPPTIHAEVDFDTLFNRLTKTWDTCINYAADKGIYVTWEFEPGFAFNKPF